jgi:competence protein ComEC
MEERAQVDVHDAVPFFVRNVEGRAEEWLQVPPSFVVKVPHHGSRSSSGSHLVAGAGARLAVVSAGPHNPFGHPHPEVVERYRRSGALVLRTDRDGTVSVATDGQQVWVRTSGEGEERRIR